MRRISFTIILVLCCGLWAKDISHWEFSKATNPQIKDSVNGLETRVVSKGDANILIDKSGNNILSFNNSANDSDKNNAILLVDDNDVLTGHNDDGDGLPSLVIEIEINPSVIKQSQLVRKTEGATDVGYQVFMTKDGRIGFYAISRKGKIARVISRNKVEVGKWQKIVAVWDGRYEVYGIQLQVDGFISWSGGKFAMNLSNTTSPLAIGGLYRAENNYGQFYCGQMKDVKISYSRPYLLNVSGRDDPFEIVPTGKHLESQKGFVKSSFIYEQPPTPECHASSIVDLGGGKLAATWFGGTHEGHTDSGIWFAKYDGKKWLKPRCLAQSPVHNQVAHISMFNPVLFKHSNGTLMLFYKEGWLEYMECRLITSQDNGETWSDIKYYEMGLMGPGKNKPVELPDGSILCTSGAKMEITPDLGKTWKTVRIENTQEFNGIIQGGFLNHKDGKLQAIFRTMREKKLVQSFSSDNGLSWTPFSTLDIPSNNSGLDTVTLKDGRHLLVYNHVITPEGKWGGARTPLNLVISDDGENWKQVFVLEDEKGKFSYPAIIQSEDGLVHISYTWNRLRVKWVVIDPKKIETSK